MTPSAASAPPDLLKILPVIVSSVAIIVSLAAAAFTAYHQYYKWPRLELVVSERLRVWLGSNGELLLNFGVTVVNTGARYGVLTRLAGDISDGPLREPLPIEWRMFIEHKNVGEAGMRFDPYGMFAGWADYLVVPTREAVAAQIQFVTQGQWESLPGQYKIRLRGYTGDRLAQGAATEFGITISDSAATLLADCRSDPGTRVSKTSVLLVREHSIS